MLKLHRDRATSGSALAGVTALVPVCALFVPQLQAGVSLGPGFSYHGRLNNNGSPVNGTTHLRFSLWDDAGAGQPPAGGNPVGNSQLVSNVPVDKGLFTVLVNAGGEFGPSAFNGESRWLQVEVCEDAGCTTSSILSPRQALSATPYAAFAAAPWTLSGTSLVYQNGNVGIGTVAPERPLHVFAGSAGAVTANPGAELVLEDDAACYLNLLSPVNFDSALLFGTPNSTADGGILYNPGGDRSMYLRTGGNVNRVKIDSNGNLGIGTMTPSAVLSVYDPGESVTQTDLTGSLANAGVNIVTDYTANAYTPGVFWRYSQILWMAA